MEDIMKQRNIEKLYHFTQANNLQNIFTYGIMPRKLLEDNEIDGFYNDQYRYDDCYNAVCTSIEFPNYKMFYKLRKDNHETDWVVIQLDACILCDFDCAYCWTNAGDATMYNIPIEERMGENAFLKLFGNQQGYPKRDKLAINDRYPTNPQAEVLVFGTIPIIYIQSLYFQNYKVLQKYKNVIPEKMPASVNTRVFSYRSDWEYWKN